MTDENADWLVVEREILDLWDVLNVQDLPLSLSPVGV